jgi:hypothetical protein
MNRSRCEARREVIEFRVMNRLVALTFALTACSNATLRAPSSASLSANEICHDSPALSATRAAMALYEGLLPEGAARLEAAVFTPTRRQATASLFFAARDEHIHFLEQLSQAHPNPLLAEMIARVKVAQPLLAASARAGAPAEWGARVLLRANPQEPDQVLIPGVALLSDRAPEALHLILLHELSHAIDPRFYPVPIEERGSSPWGEAVQCLRSPFSVAARAGGAECVEANHAPRLKEFCASKAAGLRVNPDFTEVGPYCGCPVPQGSEAFADWLAAEVLAATAADEVLVNALAWPCAAYLSEQARDAELDPQLLDQVHSADVHPLTGDRLEKIFFVQPRFRQALGATTETAAAFYCPVSE